VEAPDELRERRLVAGAKALDQLALI